MRRRVRVVRADGRETLVVCPINKALLLNALIDDILRERALHRHALEVVLTARVLEATERLVFLAHGAVSPLEMTHECTIVGLEVSHRLRHGAHLIGGIVATRVGRILRRDDNGLAADRVGTVHAPEDDPVRLGHPAVSLGVLGRCKEDPASDLVGRLIGQEGKALDAATALMEEFKLQRRRHVRADTRPDSTLQRCPSWPCAS